jgi:polysaccharide biosynthesis transport protein
MKEIERTDANEPTSGIRMTDVLFALYRHRWLILFLGMLGTAAAAFLYLTERPVYESTAKIFVRYVIENTSADPLAAERRVSPDSRGEGVLGTEVQILTSWDLAGRVASRMTGANPNREFTVEDDAEASGEGDAEQARETGATAAASPWARLEDLERQLRQWLQRETAVPSSPADDARNLAMRIRRDIRVDTPRRGSVMTVTWQSPNPTEPQRVLDQIIRVYLDRHSEVHRGTPEVMSKFSELREKARTDMELNETRISEILRSLQVTGLDDAKSALNAELLRVREALVASQADLAEQRARLEILGQSVGQRPQPAGQTNQIVSIEPPPAAVIQEYRELAERITGLRRNLNQLLGPFTEHSPLVIHLREQITQVEERRTRLEAEHPGLLGDPGSLAAASTQTDRPAGSPDILSEMVRGAALDARIKNLEEQEANLMVRLERLQAQERSLETYGRQFHIARTNYVYFEERVRRAEFDRELRGAMGEDGSPNVAIIQQPSPPARNDQGRLKKAGLALGGGFGLGILYALAFGLLLDQRLRKPSEVEVRAGLPVMLSIPNIRGLRRISVKMPLLPPPTSSEGNTGEVPLLPDLVANGKKRRGAGETDTAITRKSSPWRRDNPLRPYFEALRDRLMLLFQLREMKHKPKLVAVAGCAEGAGATTMAAGLAAALSETGDGKVLLVDLNLGRGAVHPFLRGTPVQALDEFLEDGTVKEEDAKLVVVTKANGEEEPARVPSGRLHQLMPKMRASDFDYIIFDMPAISDTSATVALAAAMDHVLIVVEGQKSTHGDVKRSVNMLRRYGASVSGVFNKSRLKGPKWLVEQS